MARTQAADYEKKRDAITEHASKLFARQGFGSASISDLATSCKVSKSLIYHYYASKEDILFDVMNDHMEALLKVTDAADYAAGLSPEAKLRALTHAILKCYTGAANKHKVLLYELDALPKKNRDIIVAKQRGVIARIERTLADCMASLQQNKARLRATAMLFFGMLNWTHTWYNSAGEISRDELADMAVDIVLKSR